MNDHENNELLELILKTAEFDRKESSSADEKSETTFKRDENGVLWCYDVKTGEKIGRIYEHGDD